MRDKNIVSRSFTHIGIFGLLHLDSLAILHFQVGRRSSVRRPWPAVVLARCSKRRYLSDQDYKARSFGLRYLELHRDFANSTANATRMVVCC